MKQYVQHHFPLTVLLILIVVPCVFVLCAYFSVTYYKLVSNPIVMSDASLGSRIW